jgi:hypothetical protein
MHHTWVLSTLCGGFVLGAIVYAVPHTQSAIEHFLFWNGAHGIALWRSYSAPLHVVEWLTTNDLESGKRTHHV